MELPGSILSSPGSGERTPYSIQVSIKIQSVFLSSALFYLPKATEQAFLHPNVPECAFCLFLPLPPVFAHCTDHSFCCPMRNHLPHYCGAITSSFLIPMVCFGQHFSQPALESWCQNLASIYTVQSLLYGQIQILLTICVKESTLCPWLLEFLEVHEKNK